MPPLDLIAWLLIVLWAFLLFGGLLFGRNPTRGRRMPRWTRLGSSLVLVVLAWYGALLAQAAPSARYALLIAAGMSAGFVGDLFMAKVLPAPNRVLAGMAVFGLGHILYIAAMTGYAPRWDRAQWVALFLWWVLGGLLFYLVVYRGRDHRFLRRASLPYALLLATSAGIATGLALRSPLFTGLAAGAALFLLSDLLIAVDLFNPGRLPRGNDLIWLTYGPGQALIVLSIWSTFQPAALL